MAEIGGASMAGIAGNNDSENGNKRIKSRVEEEGEDRISLLPDFLIHHILSFLPATDLLKTSILSKWWNYQWTHVHVLNFVPKPGTSYIRSNFIDKTLILHDCSNLHKFQIKVNNQCCDYPNLDVWIRFAVRKDVKELILDINGKCSGYFPVTYLPLPKFVFNNSSLLKLHLSGFSLKSSGKAHWVSIKSLRLYSCFVGIKAIENALSGSPVLEYLELCNCDSYRFSDLVIASKSLKTLILDGVKCRYNVIEISCPNIERLRISSLVWFRSLKLMNLMSSVYATLDFYCRLESEKVFVDYDEFDELLLDDGFLDDMSRDECIKLAQQTLRQVEHVEKLELGSWLMEWRDVIWKDQQKNALSNEVR